MIEFTVPAVRIESEMNRREHWTARRKRFAEHKRAVYFAFPRCPMHDAPWTSRVSLPAVVCLTRIGPRRLDSDNLAGGFKAVRDQIAEMIGIDDGDPRLTWRYEQEKGKPKEYAVRVRIEPAPMVILKDEEIPF